MKKTVLLSALIFFSATILSAIGNFKVVIYETASPIDVQVRISDYSPGGLGNIYTGPTESLSPNENGLIVVDVNGAGLSGIDASDIDGSYVVDVYTGNPLVLSHQKRLDNIIFHQAQAGIKDTEGNMVINDSKELRFKEPEADGDNYTAFKSPALTGNVLYTLPVDNGDPNQVLTTDGNGILSWADAAGGGGGGSNVLEMTSTGELLIDNTTYTTQPGMPGVNLEANTIYLVKGLFDLVRSGSNSDIDVEMNYTGTFDYNIYYQFLNHPFFENERLGFGVGGVVAHFFDGILKTNTAGTVKLQFRKNDPGNDNTTLLNNSLLLFIKVE